MEYTSERQLINLLLLLIGKSTDTQAVFGRGLGDEAWNDGVIPAAGYTGTMNDKGMFHGDQTGKSGVKVFGIENYWGCLCRRTNGWILDNNVIKIKLTTGTQDGSTATDYNEDGSGYINTGLSMSGGTANSDYFVGFVGDVAVNQYGIFPNVLSGGSATTQYADYGWYRPAGVWFALCGGYWVNGSRCGAFCVRLLNAASDSHASIGASPVYIPPAS
jgi:hypothetical protein